MLQRSIRELRAGEVLALSLADPARPEKVLLQAGSELNSRLIRLLERVGIRAAWVRARGTEVCDQLLDERLLAAYRGLAAGLGRAFELARTGKLGEQCLGELRDRLLPLVEHLEGRRGQPLVLPGAIREEADQPIYHGVNVCLLALATCLELDGDKARPRAELLQLGLGALLHEIGKTGVEPEILFKETWDLAQWELAQLRTYPAKGMRLLGPLLGAVVSNIALCHCVYLDGSGFPQNLEETAPPPPTGERVHPFSRIACLAKAYDELVGRGDYLPLEALEELNCARRAQFEPRALAAFNRAVPAFAPGSTLTLNSGHTAVVVGHNAEKPFRPRVLPLLDQEGRPLQEAQIKVINLADYPKARINNVHGRSIRHLLPEDPDLAWERMR